MLHRRLRRLRASEVAAGATVLEACGFRARLLGLAFLHGNELPPGHALLLPRCRSIHTFGMRFPIDVAFADEAGTVLRVVRQLQPARVAGCRGAAFALETHAGELPRFLA